jgi:hypothetical protein
MSWKTHVHMIILKLSATCFAVRVVKHFMSKDTLRMICHSYFHSIMNYAWIFWGNFSCHNNIFRLQKRIIRIITGARTWNSCREIFKILKTLPLQSQCMWFVLFMVNNKNQFKVNSEIHSINSRNNSNLFQSLTHAASYQIGTYCLGIKVQNSLPSQITIYLVI